MSDFAGGLQELASEESGERERMPADRASVALASRLRPSASWHRPSQKAASPAHRLPASKPRQNASASLRVRECARRLAERQMRAAESHQQIRPCRCHGAGPLLRADFFEQRQCTLRLAELEMVEREIREDRDALRRLAGVRAERLERFLVQRQCRGRLAGEAQRGACGRECPKRQINRIAILRTILLQHRLERFPRVVRTARVREGQCTLKLGDQCFLVLRAERAAQSLRRLGEVAQRSFTASRAEQGDASRRERAQVSERLAADVLAVDFQRAIEVVDGCRNLSALALVARRDSRRESLRFRFADRTPLSHRPLRAVAAARLRARVRRG